jgi:hypothetical protein
MHRREGLEVAMQTGFLIMAGTGSWQTPPGRLSFYQRKRWTKPLYAASIRSSMRAFARTPMTALHILRLPFWPQLWSGQEGTMYQLPKLVCSTCAP